MAKFDPSRWRHVRGTKDTPAGVVYEGQRPLRLPDKRGTVQPGQRISRRQYENMRYLQSGWANKAQYEAIQRGKPPRGAPREAKAFQAWRKIYADENKIDLSQVKGPDNKYAEAFARAYYDDFKNTSPEGPFAHLLEIVGLREPDTFWNVGDTP